MNAINGLIEGMELNERNEHEMKWNGDEAMNWWNQETQGEWSDVTKWPVKWV